MGVPHRCLAEIISELEFSYPSKLPRSFGGRRASHVRAPDTQRRCLPSFASREVYLSAQVQVGGRCGKRSLWPGRHNGMMLYTSTLQSRCFLVFLQVQVQVPLRVPKTAEPWSPGIDQIVCFKQFM